MSIINFLRLAILSLLLFSQEGNAGLLYKFSVGTGSFSFTPKTNEETPNYQGLNLGLSLGYAFKMLFTNLSYDQTRGSYKAFGLIEPDSTLSSATIDLGLRFANATVGVSSGYTTYKLAKENKSFSEVKGQGSGIGGGIYLGFLLKLKRKQFIEILMSYSQYSINPKNDKSSMRRIDYAKISLNYILGRSA